MARRASEAVLSDAGIPAEHLDASSYFSQHAELAHEEAYGGGRPQPTDWGRGDNLRAGLGPVRIAARYRRQVFHENMAWSSFTMSRAVMSQKYFAFQHDERPGKVFVCTE